ncbi:MAG: hypothetical protein A2Y14_05115 [Verrucomicrobia bacterium GWF2_51_19]|nr:MAG: hypothetical protein A2Y14_05115 [Verrucomicrobia bacterium GWF2_51_19]HCJ12488.1 glycosyl transferase family 1 [Opitutae bacterium]
MIALKDITYRVPGRILLDKVSVALPDSIIGVVGQNGCGKTTLFRLLTGECKPDAGEILIPKRLKLVAVEQEIKETGKSLLAFVLDADSELTRLRAALHDTPTEELGDIYQQLEHIDAFSAEGRAASILSGLGFSPEDLERPLSDFSGGWQMRASMAATLFAPFDILLLDEPTNHLDLETGLWLEQYLGRLNKTVLIVSHERHFLNRLCGHILHIHDRTAKLYTGNYDTFVETRQIQQHSLAKSIEKQQKTREHLQAFIDRFRYKATKAKQAQSRIKVLEKMAALPTLSRDTSVTFEFPQPEEVDRFLITLKDGVAGYDKPVLRSLNVRVEVNDRIALLGKNGNGKSTLAKILTERLDLLSGTMQRAKKLQVAYFSQQQTDELDLTQTPYSALAAILPDLPESKVRAQLARFGLMQEKANTRIGQLSGGEKTRLLLALITRNAPHMLVFDEPTNHLDIDARDALIDALNAYRGAVVLVTHDFHTIESVCDQLWLVKDGHCRPFDGDLDDYKNLLLTPVTVAKPQKANKTKPAKPTQKLAAIEKQLKDAEAEKAALEAALQQRYSLDTCKQLEQLNAAIQSLEQQWLNAGEALQ